ncbi:MAG: DedA family protein [Candidatus Eremiobacteraeota bacterium]|nr:DedA family protein [Candidatus Eremiobacteraeota bacterium]MBV9647257.1 DedA family protein [Candidatus Eremiobacteraeota bacterium]
MEHLAHSLLQFIDREGYVALFVVLALGNIGVPIGAEIVIPAAGALVAKGHLSSLWLATLIVLCGELAGQLILYAVGFWGGRPFVARWGRLVGLSLHKLDIAHSFYERYGNGTVFLCRFIPFIRGVAGLPAGISRMELGRFILYTLAGSALFCFGLVALGYTLGNHLNEALPWIRSAALLVLAIAVIVVVYLAVRRRTERKGAASG